MKNNQKNPKCKWQRIAVIMGGNSSERTISLASGRAILQALKKHKIDCFEFDWHGDNLADLYTYKFDKVFIALHGKGGEDGFIQQQLAQQNISYTGTNADNSKNCMDKNLTKKICAQSSIISPNWIIVRKNNPIPSINFPIPWAIKPTLEGSSIGISKIVEKSNLQDGLNAAFEYGDEIIIEQWIIGKEYSVAIVMGEALPVVEIIASHEFYDYRAKYQSETTNYICPAVLSTMLTQKIQNLATKIYTIMGMKDWGRIDFIRDDKDNFYLLEVNTVPGMTSHSLVPMAAQAINLSFGQLIIQILNG